MRKWLDGIAAVAMIVASGVIVWSLVSKPSASRLGLARPERPLPSDPVLIEGVAFRGDPSAPLIMTVFSDFQCPVLRSIRSRDVASFDLTLCRHG